MKYRQKIKIVEAFQWTADVNQTEDPEWMVKALIEGAAVISKNISNQVTMTIWNQFGRVHVFPGDYIIRAPNGDLDVMRKREFEDKYEKMEEEYTCLVFLSEGYMNSSECSEKCDCHNTGKVKIEKEEKNAGRENSVPETAVQPDGRGDSDGGEGNGNGGVGTGGLGEVKKGGDAEVQRPNSGTGKGHLGRSNKNK